jgi:hypothetical protein
MRQSAQLVLLVSLTFFTGAALAADHGQFENVPEDIRAWFKRRAQPSWRSMLRHFRWAWHGVRRASGSLLGSNQWFVVGVPEKAIVRNAGNRLAKPLFGMSVFGAISRFAASSRPMLVRPVVSATNGIDGSDSYLRAPESYHSECRS